MPIGRVTRGTTGVNRLRRVDRWIAAQPALRRADDPLVVDLGYGASGATAFELGARLATVRPDVRVHGFEIEPERVRVAREQLAGLPADVRDRHAFDVGGFELPLARRARPAIVRAFNVLRQYDEGEVRDAWATMRARLAPGGLLVEGTCNEVGRVATWFGIDAEGPRTFTVALHLASVDSPLVLAERLPKALIHHNVPGEPVHAFLRELDGAWRTEAPRGTFGPRQRWIASVERVRAAGWPVVDGARRWRLGELTIRADAVLPDASATG